VEEFVENATDVEGSAKSTVRKKQASRAIARHYFFHTLAGRAANDAISRVAALRLSRRSGEKSFAAADDYGFVLTMRPSQSISADEIVTLLAPANFEGDLRESISSSNLIKSCFRDAAQTGLMSYERHAGEQKVVRKLQFSSELMFNLLQQHEPDHVLMRQAWRDASSVYLDIDEAMRFLTGAIGKPVHLRTVAQVPPLSFALFAPRKTISAENPGETPDKLFHLWWNELAVEESP
jgi:ATP-dependent Lhr-like helicase